MKLTKDGLYPIGDYVSNEKMEELAGKKLTLNEKMVLSHSVRGKWNGEKRIPKKGEWYLSGAEITAYRAPNDFANQTFHIAKLVLTETVTTTREI